eukprot:m.119320 g.119320  ORF g.119320 m.119320 type:complete len:284 (-) comp14311_c0_seq5:1075-1926(-)
MANKDADVSDILDQALEEFSSSESEGENEPNETASASKNISSEDAVPLTSPNWPPHVSPQPLKQTSFLGHTLGQRPQTAQEIEDDSLKDILEKLKLNTQNLDDEDIDVEKLLGDLGADVPDSLLEDVMKGMQGGGGVDVMEQMMEHLLTKELLYPSLIDIRSKYSEWLDENKGEIPESDYTKYSEQYKIILSICGVYEDDTIGKQDQSKRVLEYMEKIQPLGAPPEAIMSSMGVSLGLVVLVVAFSCKMKTFSYAVKTGSQHFPGLVCWEAEANVLLCEPVAF